jgi:CheY-like chemotaxis protein
MKHKPLILLVDDDEMDAFLIRRTLANAGVSNPHRVLRSGEAVISYLKGEGAYADREQHPLPGLVLLDLSMPGIGGFEVLRWIRSQPELNALRVIVLTASSDAHDADLAHQMGANFFLDKSRDFESVHLLGATLKDQRVWMTERW